MAEENQPIVPEETAPLAPAYSQPPTAHAPPPLTSTGVSSTHSRGPLVHLPSPASSGIPPAYSGTPLAQVPPPVAQAPPTSGEPARIAALDGAFSQMIADVVELMALFKGPNRTSLSSTSPLGQGPTIDPNPWVLPTHIPKSGDAPTPPTMHVLAVHSINIPSPLLTLPAAVPPPLMTILTSDLAIFVPPPRKRGDDGNIDISLLEAVERSHNTVEVLDLKTLKKLVFSFERRLKENIEASLKENDSGLLRLTRVLQIRSFLGPSDACIHGSRGCLGCCSEYPLILGEDRPLKEVRKSQSETVKKPGIADDFWSTSAHEMDLSHRSLSSANTSSQTLDSQHNAGSTSNSPEFVNPGNWNATYEGLLGTNKPFPQPIPLSEMVDFLVDVWKQEGFYD
ncbi:hypothetical protein CDL15_Pgr002670 [Punica granatum]|uniref:Gag1-like clamp domain-containing protein n=1 Tax=Punica granatum TaxID=22663 RepID=A0A218WF98_PUNGR|nr:hypothetical protein CDL15_Pgr002670 [Punica granatum]